MLFWHWRSLLNHLTSPFKFRFGWRGASSCLSRGGLKRMKAEKVTIQLFSGAKISPRFPLFSLQAALGITTFYPLICAGSNDNILYPSPLVCVCVCVPCLGELRWDSLISSAFIRQRSNSSAMPLNSTESDLLISFFRCHSVLCLVAKDSWRGAEFFCLSSTDATFSAVGCRAFNLPNIPHEVKLCWTFQSLFCYYEAEFWNQRNGCNFGISTRPSSLNTGNMSCLAVELRPAFSGCLS